MQSKTPVLKIATIDDDGVRSRMFPKLHPHNLRQLASIISHPKVKEVWMHADGNFYVDTTRADGSVIPAKESSDNAALYVNDNSASRPAKYRIKFTSAKEIPDDLEELELMFIKAKQAEEIQEQAERYTADNNNFTFDAGGLVDASAPKEQAKETLPTRPQAEEPYIPAITEVADDPNLGKGQASAKVAAALAEASDSPTPVKPVEPLGEATMAPPPPPAAEKGKTK